MNKRLHYFQHVGFEGAGIIKPWAEQNDFSVTRTAFFDNEQVPSLEDIDWLVIMGGPMGVYDETKYPWLADEKKFISEAISGGKKVLGICLGAQLIADALGARVYPNRYKEIGWFPVKKCDNGNSVSNVLPDDFHVFHWHSDTFDIPQCAERIILSKACANQAFSFDNGRVVALQFHMEMSAEDIRLLVENCYNGLDRSPYVQKKGEILGQTSYIDNANKLVKLLLQKQKGG